MTYDEIWEKYERKVRAEVGADTPLEEVNRLVALRILEKSCQTNKAFDKFGNVEEALSRFRSGQDWRPASLADRLQWQCSKLLKAYMMSGAWTMLS